MITTPQTRLLTDPLFSDFVFGLRRAEAACLHRADAAEVTLILISHAHRDHLHLPSLRRLSRAATVILPPRCGALVEGLGFGRVLVLEPGETFTQGDVTVTAVAARHDGRRGLGGWSWRGAAGYVVRTSALSAYFAGDTGYFSAFEEIGRTHRPDVALLPIAGYEPAGLRENNMSPLDALYALEDLGSPTLIPIGFGSFSLGYEPLSEPLRWLNALSAERGMADKVAVLGHGETLVLPRPTSRVDVPPTVG